MVWLAVNKNGQEIISPEKPIRYWNEWIYKEEMCIEGECGDVQYEIYIPKGTIKKLIGYELTWEDEPVEI